nr:DUF58 domain-containing protein [uncultured Microbacterium sp.]
MAKSGVGQAAAHQRAMLAAAGVAFSRPDVVVLGLPFALWCVLVLRRPRPARIAVTLDAGSGAEPGTVHGTVGVRAGADWVQLAIDQGGVRRGVADAADGDAVVRTTARLRHSGPVELIAATARAVAFDGAWVSTTVPRRTLDWNAAPTPIRLGALPVASRLRGLHGIHRGSRPGQGGDFRDIHPFAPGDELRRVDWRATARLARRPGDLLVRRTDTLSDASVVIMIDTADDLGAVVATWGFPDPDRSGVTSLDLARQAALSIATAAIAAGDRVALHELSAGGRTIAPGAGVRHLARLRRAIAATGVSGTTTRYRRTPPVPHGATVHVLSPFIDRGATTLALALRASGHRVVAVDVLPVLDDARLNREQRLALRTVSAEHDDALIELRHAGADAIAWRLDGDGADAALRSAGRMRR